MLPDDSLQLRQDRLHDWPPGLSQGHPPEVPGPRERDWGSSVLPDDPLRQPLSHGQGLGPTVPHGDLGALPGIASRVQGSGLFGGDAEADWSRLPQPRSPGELRPNIGNPTYGLSESSQSPQVVDWWKSKDTIATTTTGQL